MEAVAVMRWAYKYNRAVQFVGNEKIVVKKSLSQIAITLTGRGDCIVP